MQFFRIFVISSVSIHRISDDCARCWCSIFSGRSHIYIVYCIPLQFVAYTLPLNILDFTGSMIMFFRKLQYAVKFISLDERLALFFNTRPSLNSMCQTFVETKFEIIHYN
uniref:Uncharacterized protein n=1 Tax=Cacopsylla melanoneura TaxID=428564 RepID=A0A8D8YFH5_9HEMI